MNGPEHYREAERLLDHARQPYPKPAGEFEQLNTTEAVALAQAHATLAQAAALDDLARNNSKGNR